MIQAGSARAAWRLVARRPLRASPHRLGRTFWSNRVEGGSGTLAHLKSDRSRIGPDIKLIDEWLHFSPRPETKVTEEDAADSTTDSTATTAAEERARILEHERHLVMEETPSEKRAVVLNTLRESPSLRHLCADGPDDATWAERLRSAHEARSALQPGCENFVVPSSQWKPVGVDSDDGECHPAWTPEVRRVVHPSGLGHLFSSVQRMMIGMEERDDFQEGLRHSFVAVTNLLGDSARNATLKLRAGTREANGDVHADSADAECELDGRDSGSGPPESWVLHPDLEKMLEPRLFRSLEQAVANVGNGAAGPIAPLDPSSDRDHSGLAPLFHLEGVLMSEPFISHCCFIIGGVRGAEGQPDGFEIQQAIGPVGEHECLNGGFVVCFPKGVGELVRRNRGGGFSAGFELANDLIARGGMTMRMAVNFDVSELLVHRTGSSVGQASQYPWMRTTRQWVFETPLIGADPKRPPGTTMTEEDLRAMQREMEWRVVDMDSALEGNPFWFPEEEDGADGAAKNSG